jgi:hypothetical protein
VTSAGNLKSELFSFFLFVRFSLSLSNDHRALIHINLIHAATKTRSDMDARKMRDLPVRTVQQNHQKEALFSLFCSHLFLFFSFKTSCLGINEDFTSSEEHGV